jgi:hypothetical protein
MEGQPNIEQPPTVVNQVVQNAPVASPAPEEKKQIEMPLSSPPDKLAEEENKKLIAADPEQFLNKDHSDSNMVVAIRVRPLSQKEISNMEYSILSIEDKLMVN